MYARVTLLFLALLVAGSASAQTTSRIYAIDPTTFGRVMFGDATNNAMRAVQVAGTQVATVYWSFRLTDGSTYLAPAVDYMHNTALTPATTTGPVTMLRGSAVSPTATGADDRGTMAWGLPNGAIANSNAASSAAGIAAPECVVLSAATTNATNCKASPGNWYGYDLINTTTTLYYLRLYDLSAAPTCSSATGFIRSIPIPPAGSAGQAGGAIRLFVIPVQYTTGIGFCLTSGSSSTDNNAAAVGVFGALLYK